jgi:hypothetical protein
VPGPALATTRRATFGGLLALLTVSACDTDDLRPPEADEPTSTNPQSPSPDSDEVLVEEVAAAIIGALDLVGLVRRRFPQLQPAMGPLARMHRAHLGVLHVEVETRTATSVPASAPVALARLRGEEQRLQKAMAKAAVRARSGALARLLASMSAAVAQQLAVLPDQPPAGDQQ